MNTTNIAKAVNEAGRLVVLKDKVPVAYSVVLLTGEKSFGACYKNKPCIVGDTMHFDHGGGIKPNSDATIEWVKPYFDYKSERDALMKLNVEDRPKVLQGDYYTYDKSGLVVAECYGIKENGEYRAFPAFIVIRQGTKGNFWHNATEVGERLNVGLTFHTVIKSFTKLCKFEHSTRFKPKAN